MESIAESDQLGEFYPFVDAHPELKQWENGEHFGKTQSWVSKRLTARKRAGFTSGEPHSEPDEDPQPIATVHPGSPDGLPDIARQSDLDDLKTRVEVLEAFIKILQRQPSYHGGAPLGEPPATHKRGFVLADDVWDTIRRYAAARHWQIAPVADLAFCTFFAQLGEEVRGE